MARTGIVAGQTAASRVRLGPMTADTKTSTIPNFAKIVVDSGAVMSSTIAKRVIGGIALGIAFGIVTFFVAYGVGALDTDGSIAKYAVWLLLPANAAIAAIGFGYAGFALGKSTALDRVFIQSGVVARFVSDLLDRIGIELIGRADAAEAVDAAIEAKKADEPAAEGIGAFAVSIARRIKIFIYRICARVLVSELQGKNKIADEAREQLVATVVGRVGDMLTGAGRQTAMVAAGLAVVVMAIVTGGVALAL